MLKMAGPDDGRIQDAAGGDHRMRMLVLDDDTIRRELSILEVIELIDRALVDDALGHIKTVPVIKEDLPGARGTWVVKAGHVHATAADGVSQRHVIGLKLGGYCPANREREMPSHSAAMLLTDPDTGRPYSLLAANTITTLRTAAAGAIAARQLAGCRAGHVAILGTGEQAHAQLAAWNAIGRIEQVMVWGRTPERSEAYARLWKRRGLDIRACDTAEQAVRAAGLIITTTPARSPILQMEWVQPGTHINAIGADASGKQELDAKLVAAASLFVDKAAQSLTIGEMQVPVATRLVTGKHILAELGQVCAGLAAGRTSDDEITIFDSTGVAFQDLAVAGHLYQKATLDQFGFNIFL